jgi:hypothetical protein
MFTAIYMCMVFCIYKKDYGIIPCLLWIFYLKDLALKDSDLFLISPVGIATSYSCNVKQLSEINSTSDQIVMKPSNGAFA